MTNAEIKISLDYIASMASDIKNILKYDYEISEKLTEMDYCSNIENEAEKIIKALEQQRWIPVSERLPENTGWYLITFKTANGVAVCELSYRKPENYWTDKDISKKVFDNNDIVAWMPLLEPYKAESEE